MFLFRYEGSVLIVGAVNSGLDKTHSRSLGALAFAKMRKYLQHMPPHRPSVHREMNLDAPRNRQPPASRI
jgi:hypothetical protein